jgi:hypothetical protein
MSAPTELKLDVAVPPKYAVPKLEKLVEEALPAKGCRALQAFWDEVDTLLVPPAVSRRLLQDFHRGG